jgi:hypothetical protein
LLRLLLIDVTLFGLRPVFEVHALSVTQALPHALRHEGAERSKQGGDAAKNAIERGVERHLARLPRVRAPHTGAASPDIPVVQRVEKRRKQLCGFMNGVTVHAFGGTLNNKFRLGQNEAVEFVE